MFVDESSPFKYDNPLPPIFHQQGKLYKYHLKSIQQLTLRFIFGAQTSTVSHLSHIYV